MRADEDDEGETSAFRCLNAARYTVAAMVTVLIVFVVVISLKVMLRPEYLRLSVVDGSVYSTPQPARKAVSLQLNLRSENPSGRARMFFLNVTAYLFNSTASASTSTPDDDCIVSLDTPDKTLWPQTAVDSMMKVHANNEVMDQAYLDKLLYSKGGVIGDMTLRVDGRIVTEVSSRVNMTRPQVIYYCWPILVGGSKGSEVSNGRKDVLCTATDNLVGSQ